MMINETITEAPKDCDDSGAIWDSGIYYYSNIDITINSFSHFSVLLNKLLFSFCFSFSPIHYCFQSDEYV